MAVNAGLGKGTFVAVDEIYHHPQLPLYVVGRWYGSHYAVGDASAGSVQVQLCPENLPVGYPRDFYFTVHNLLLRGTTGAGALHELNGYSDDWFNELGNYATASIIGVDSAIGNLPSAGTIPVWLAWVLHRIIRIGDDQVGQLAMTWGTNVNLGTYLMHAAGLVLLAHDIMPSELRSRIVRL